MVLGLSIHVLAAVIWVGGLFCTSAMLRPTEMALEPAVRYRFWHAVVTRSLLWGWLSIAAVLLSGLAMVYLGFGGFAGLPVYVRTMMMSGVLMTAVYTYLYFVPWRRFRHAMSRADWAAGERNVGRIRGLVAVNLGLGLITVGTAVGGRYFG